MKTDYENLPNWFLENGDFCLWRLQAVNGTMKKIPYSPKNPKKKIDVTAKESYTDFYDAETALTEWNESANDNTLKFNGIGIRLGVYDDKSLLCIDLDHCFNLENELIEESSEIVRYFNSCTEVSQSGEGLHIYFTVDWNKVFPTERFENNEFIINEERIPFNSRYCNRPKDYALEFYPDDRFIAQTGIYYNELKEVKDCTELLESFLNKYCLRPAPRKKKGLINQKTKKSQEYIKNRGREYVLENIRLSKNGDKFIDLCNTGNWEKYGYGSESDARWFMINTFLYYTGLNANWTIELLKSTQLFKNSPKAYDKREDKTLIEYEVGRALSQWNGGYFLPLESDVLREVINSLGIEIKYNMLTYRTEYKVPEDDLKFNLPGDALVESMPTIIWEELNKSGSPVKLSERMITSLLNLYAKRNYYNPVQDYLRSRNWDKVDRFQEIFKILGIEKETEDNLFYQNLVRKWFYQATQVIFNDFKDIKKSEGVLVLWGAEGIGKTSFFQQLVPDPDWFYSYNTDFNPNSKDCLTEIISHWIVEIGEIDESILKGLKQDDTKNLKGFITQDKVNIRLPYDRVSQRRPRLVTICGTTNNPEFLTIAAGDRRWWIIPIEDINFKILNKFREKENLAQFWAQCYEEGSKQGAYSLNDEERAKLKEYNKAYKVPLAGETLIRDRYNWEVNKELYEWKTVSEVLNDLSIVNTQKIHDRQVAKILRKLENEGLTQSSKPHNRLHFKMPPLRKYGEEVDSTLLKESNMNELNKPIGEDPIITYENPQPKSFWESLI